MTKGWYASVLNGIGRICAWRSCTVATNCVPLMARGGRSSVLQRATPLTEVQGTPIGTSTAMPFVTPLQNPATNHGNVAEARRRS